MYNVIRYSNFSRCIIIIELDANRFLSFKVLSTYSDAGDDFVLMSGQFDPHSVCVQVCESHNIIMTSVKIIKNEVACRDDTVPKTVETRRHCEED